MKRRTALIGSLSGLLSGCVRRLTPRASDAPLDVLVVGGGLAGLSAAAALEAAGAKTLVIEAQDRLGGRVETQRSQTLVAERGAQFFNRDMPLIRALIEKAGVSTVSLDPQRQLVCVDEGGASLDAGPEGVLERLGDEALLAISQRLHRDGDLPMSELVKRAKPQDAQRVHSMLQELTGKAPSLLSLGGAMHTVESFASTAPPEEYAATGGLDRAVQSLVAQLRTAPKLGCEALSVRWGDRYQTVATSSGSFRARAIVFAVPPPVAARLVFAPALPLPLSTALRAFVGGDMLKVTLGFRSPFWRRSAMPTDFISLSPMGLTATELPGNPARLVLFIGGDTARMLVRESPTDRAAFYRDFMQRASGVAPQEPQWIVEGNWVDSRWSAGGYNSWLRYGEPTESAQLLRQGVGPLLFAGSELSTRFTGYMEGALHSGQETARDCLAALARAQR